MGDHKGQREGMLDRSVHVVHLPPEEYSVLAVRAKWHASGYATLPATDPTYAGAPGAA